MADAATRRMGGQERVRPLRRGARGFRRDFHRRVDVLERARASRWRSERRGRRCGRRPDGRSAGDAQSRDAEPYGNLYSTAPGAEQQAVRPQFRFNVLAPLNFDFNAEAVSSDGTQSWGTFPVGNLSWAAPVGDLPFRVSVFARSEFKRYFDASDVDIDRLTFSGRLQYVDPTNDQAFSPYFAITPRFSYLPTFSDQTEARQDFNLGFNKSFHFDSSFRPVPIGRRHVRRNGLVLRPHRLRAEAIPTASALIGRALPHSLGFVGHLRELERERRRRVARPLVRGGQVRGDEPRLGGAADRDARIYRPGVVCSAATSFANLLGRPAIDLQGLASESLVDRAAGQLRPMGGERDPEARLAVLASMRRASNKPRLAERTPMIGRPLRFGPSATAGRAVV